jgi:hypothetical protein
LESWRKKYRNNFAVGTSISITVHLLLFLILFFFPPVISESPLQYFDNSYIVKLASVNIGKVDIGGGGSDGSEGTGRDFSSAKTLSGIPVPVSELTDIEFGKEANLIEPKDSLLIPGGGGLGAGSGGIGGGKGSGMGDGSGSGSGYISLPFVPRQILEVVPQNVEGVKGTIILVLKIGTDGFVKEDKIIYNTTNNSECLKNTIEAAYKSRWEQIKIEGKQIQYWIEKTYKFN